MSDESFLVEIFVREIGYYRVGGEVMIPTPDGKYIAKKIHAFEEVATSQQSEFLFALDEKNKTILKIRKDAIVERTYL